MGYSRFCGLYRRWEGRFSTVTPEGRPEPGPAFLDTHRRFVKAVRVGETITAEFKVTDLREDKPMCKLEARA